MASGPNVVFLVDTAGRATKNRVRLSSLRLLNYLGCRFGLDQIRWAFRFFDSSSARSVKPPRLGDFRELGPRSWLDFEESLESRFEAAREEEVPRGRGLRAVLTQGALKEILLDYPWDRPDITSPAKPARPRTRRGGRLVLQEEPSQAETGSENAIAPKSRNAIFIFSSCPHSSAELLRFTEGSHEKVPSSQQVLDRLLPRSVQSVIAKKKITLYWMDSTERSKVWNSSDLVGYWTVSEVIRLVGGSILPSEALMFCSSRHKENRVHNIEDISLGEANLSFSDLQVKSCPADLPFDSILNHFIFSDLACRAVFPQQEGVLVFIAHGLEQQWKCVVELEPVAMNQRYLKSPVRITLKGTMKDGNCLQSCNYSTASWVLCSSKKQGSEHTVTLFHELVKRLAFEELHMVADVSTCEDLSPSTGILSAVSDSIAVLTVIYTEKAIELERPFLQESATENTEDITSDLPDIVKSVLNHIYNSTEDDLASTKKAMPVPEWAQQELTRSNRWSSSVVEEWYLFSDVRGASSSLMESFRLLQAISADEKEEIWKADLDLINCLSELYQIKSSDECGTAGRGESKKCVMPRTPVRQKMKTLSRSLQMLNAARLNVKAQRFQQDGLPLPTNERVSQKRSMRKSDKGKSVKSMDFKTEEEMISHLNEDYQKTITEGNASLYAHNAIAVIKSYLKSQTTEKLEADCMDTIRNFLLKTSEAIRQQFGKSQDKEAKVRECEIQVFLRLEMCVECPSVQNNTDSMEQMIEEITDMLRILSLTEDPTYLTKFLEEVLTLYTASIPKILGDLYFSLGIQIPKALVSALPAEIFSSDSVTQEDKSPCSHLLVSRAPSGASVTTVTDQLEELRTRSIKKRRTSVLARHRSITEPSQNLRQIELPRVPKRRPSKEKSHSYLAAIEKLQQLPHSSPLKKEADQEVTKVRRNLFIKEICSPSKKSTKMSRSHSVSAVESLKHSRSQGSSKASVSSNNHELFTSVLFRGSDLGSDFGVVEESPERMPGGMELRRSPRIKQLSLSRKYSSSFYSCSQPKSCNLGKVRSASLEWRSSEQTDNTFPREVHAVKSPKRLLFGAVLGMNSPFGIKELKRNSSTSMEPIVNQVTTPEKSSGRIPQKPQSSTGNRMLRKSQVVHAPQSIHNSSEETPLCSPVKKTAAKSLEKYFSTFEAVDQPFKPSGTRIECLARLSPAKDTFSNESISSLLSQATELQSSEKESEDNNVLGSSLGTPRRILNLITPVKSRPSTPCTPFKIQELQTSGRDSVQSSQNLPVSSAFVSLGKSLQAEKLVLKIQRTPNKNSIVTSHVSEVIPNLILPSILRGPKDASDVSPSKINKVLPFEFSNILTSPSRKVITDSLSRVESRQPIYAFCETPKKSLNSENIAAVSSEKSLKVPVSPRNSRGQSETEENLFSLYQSQIFRDGEKLNPNKNIKLSKNFIFHTSELSDNLSLVAEVLSPFKNEGTLSCSPTQKECSQILSDVDLVRERLNLSSLTNSGTSESQTEESIDISEARVLSAEGSGLKMKLHVTRKPSITETVDALPSAPWSEGYSPAYELRCTPDRRQRQAAARLSTPKFSTKFSTPKSQCKLVRAVTPTYEVELEMQASGLPKLRFKRTDSNTALDTMTKKKSPTPKVLYKHKEDESPFSEPNGVWCSRHLGKVESACVSPSCFCSSNSTPGKRGMQTYICQSYTPTRCVSTNSSPSHQDVGVPWTPSPKLKEKMTVDTIKNWPRRKRATAAIPTHSIGKNEKNQEFRDIESTAEEEAELISKYHSNKNMILEEFELDGVCKLQDQSPTTEWKERTEESTANGIFGLKSRKRGCNYSSHENVMHQEFKKVHTSINEDLDLAKGTYIEQSEAVAGKKFKSSSRNVSSSTESSTQHISLDDDDVFINEGLTSPNKILKSSLSASGLLALTQSPLLYQGKTSTSNRSTRDNEVDLGTPVRKAVTVHSTANQGESPFGRDSSQQSIIKTYSRKKLIS
uniref:Treslin n=1 Tax=Geotrypetes seraphini TaxID=260995 RepID=A0A6P8PPP8_GEOSA|nr:treslin [Geotrypetes seraphini]